MALTYIEALGRGFPNVQATAIGEGLVYEDIMWSSPPNQRPTKAELDAYIQSQIVAGEKPKRVMVASYSDTVAPRSGNTIIPYDKTIPLSTEGTLIWSQTVTPQSEKSVYNINFSSFVASGSGTRYVTAAVFKGDVCIGASTVLASVANAPFQLCVATTDEIGTTVPVTYSIRIGNSSNSIWYLGQTLTATFGGVGNSVVTMNELVQE